MAPQPLAYRDFVRVCIALRQLRDSSAHLDSWLIRDALVARFRKDRPALAATLSRLTNEQIKTLVSHADRHNAGS
jgi:hypothetical protein